MLNYKVEFDEDTRQIKVRFFNDEGEEVKPEKGTYKITVPANTFMWYGDGVSCDGKNGNDEFTYLYRVVDKAPAPEIKAFIKGGIIYFVVENSSSPQTKKELGYTTQSTNVENIVSFLPYVELDNIQWVPNGDVSQFGYTERKSFYYVNLKDSFNYIPDTQYTANLLANTVVNIGDGDAYEASPVPNKMATTTFQTPPSPEVSITSITYDTKTNKLTAVADLSSVYTKRGLWRTSSEALHSPVVTNDAETVSVEALDVQWDDEKMTMEFNIKNPDSFLKYNPDSSKYMKFNVKVLADFLLNTGNGSEFIGTCGNKATSASKTVKSLNKVSKPVIVKETRDSSMLTLDWNNVYTNDMVTSRSGDASLVAVMKDGTARNVSSYVKFTYPSKSNKKLVAKYDTGNNFGLDPTLVQRFELRLPEGLIQNDGDDEFTSGHTESEQKSYNYSPVDCKPKLNLNEINMAPLYPIIDGERLSPLHDAEITTFGKDVLKISDPDGNVLMRWSDQPFDEIESIEGYGESGVTEDISTYQTRRYYDRDMGRFIASGMYSPNGAYEAYTGNKIVLSVNPTAVVTKGDGFTCLGTLSGETDTPTQTKYVLEFSIPSNNKDFLGKMVSENYLAGPVDWNEEYITSCMTEGHRYSKPYFMGCYGWGSENNPQDTPYEVNNDLYLTKTMNIALGPYDFQQRVFSNEYDDYYYRYIVAFYSGDEEISESDKEYEKNRVKSHAEWNGGEFAYLSWVEDYMQRNPLKLISKDNSLYYGRYSGYWGDMTNEEKEAMVNDFMEFHRVRAVNNVCNLFLIRQNNYETYSFLYDKPSSHWAFGAQGRLYNNGTMNPNTNRVLYIKEVKKIDTSRQTDFSWMFANQSSLTKISAKFDMSNATAMTGMFYKCDDLKAEIAHEVFEGEINTEDKLNDVLYADHAFEACNCITALPDSFQFANLYDGTAMFANCNSLMKLPDAFNPTNLEIADDMLKGDYSYPLFAYDEQHNFKCYGAYPYYDETEKKGCEQKWKDEHPTHTYTDLHFPIEFAIRNIPETWKSVSKIKSADGMFAARAVLETVPHFWNFEKLENGNRMFHGCASLRTIPTAWTSTDNLVSANNMFTQCSSITKVHNGFKCRNLESANFMFDGCSSLTAINEDFQPLNLVNANSMLAFTPNLKKIPASWTNIETVEKANGMLQGCGIEKLPDSWTVCNATETEFMFTDTKLTKIKMDFPNLQRCYAIFGDTPLLKEVDGVIDFANLPLGQDINIMYNSSCTKFRIENLGKKSNLYTGDSKTQREVNPIFYFMNVDYETWAEQDIIDWLDSIFYMLDHANTGTTEKNSESVSTKRTVTYDRHMDGHYIYLRLPIKFLVDREDFIRQRLEANPHEQVTKDVFLAWLNSSMGDRAKTGWSYRIQAQVI